ncbi:MAG: hypothetical protein HY289_15760 [Planctomycetes bacterium]|nr:hypothetical protein [Planctomycetota bacterium]
MTTFAGRWITTYGPMELRDEAGALRGNYWYQGIPCSIEGSVKEARFDFRYRDPSGVGTGWFEATRYGHIRGQYCLDGDTVWRDWTAQREWDGIWDASYGRMRLIQEDGRAFGFYEGAGPARIEGRVEGKRLVFRYFEPKVQGEGWFELADGAGSFAGAWRPDGASAWGQWQGRRVVPQAGLTWLVVLEAHWQKSLADGEYSYGNMLKEFFARLPNVAVRQRFFNDGVSLQRWCRELIYVPEPAIVLISSHGLPEGVTVQGQTIDTKLVIDGLQHANDIKLLHFATCLMLKEESVGDFARRIAAQVPYPISGYATSIDWGGSAVLEFSYFDMILGKGLAPEEAARLLPTVVTYAGDRVAAGAPYAAVGFRYFKPGRS